ncbi:discoidin domain-containing protein [Streptomyces filamentosus]|uniref:Glycosyl hydrolase n=1 Tax=Streptomyces filamentosus TaxID=67294 RepID=A0A919BSK3_STRFL|nr:discoidin domain-containing protein [Streptomyces filamentosus]GHG10229.1 glycosyl hydrolase [Streptomyces filamentosus]
MTIRNWRSRCLSAAVATSLLALGGPLMTAEAAGGPNVALDDAAAASSAHTEYGAGNVTDGRQDSYWQSAGPAFPQWVQADLGSATRVDEVVLKLPAGWEGRNQTLSVQGSADGTSFTTLKSSATYAFTPGAGNTVTIAFPAAQTRFVRVDITANTGWQAAQLSELEVHAADGTSPNLAAGKTLTAGSQTQTYVPARANDGNRATYWESAGGAFPQWIQADLGAALRVDRVVLRLPDGWEDRSQTLKIQGSTDGTAFTDLTTAQAYAFDAAGGRSATVTFGSTTTRYVRVVFTANSVQNAAQLSELEVYGPATGDTRAPTAPANLAYTEPGAGQIRLTWTASTDDTAVTAYDVYADGTLLTSVAGDVTTYTDTRPADRTVTYKVRARDAAGNQSADSAPVTRPGATGDTQAPTIPANLAYTEPGPGQIRLTWTASTDDTGVTGYEVYANGTLRATVAGTATTYTDTQPTTSTVTYRVRARDAAGNRSADSGAVTRNGSGGTGSNLAVGKAISASSTVHTFVAAHANDNSTATYWEGAGGAYPNTLTVRLGANADVDRLVLKLSPDASWGARSQTIEVLGRAQDATGFTGLVAAKSYSFDPGTGNQVTLPVAARTADVQLRITANTGAPAGQIAEFQVIGVPAPNPDLRVTGLTAAPAAPVESDPVTVSATVRNDGTAAAPASSLAVRLGGTKVATAAVGPLAAGAQTTVTASIGAREAGSYELSAVADEAEAVVEQNETDNTYTSPTPLVVKPVESSDPVVDSLATSPSSPSAGDAVTFRAVVRNQGTVATTAGTHGVTLTVLNEQGGTVKTLTGSYGGALAAGARAEVSLGPWTAADGSYTVRTVLADDGNELPVKRGNNTATQPLFVGRGANMPYDTYEAEDAVTGGGATVVGPNRTVGDPAGEASGRRAVTLDATGEYVEFTTRAATNTLVTRFSIPDAPGGGGIDSTIDVYVDGVFKKALPLTSKYAWLYGSETAPGNSPGAGGPRHIYDEAQLMLGETVPAGSRIRLQKDAANTSTYAIDFVDLEQVAPVANPDPAAYAVPAGFGHQDVQNALDRVRTDTTGTLVGVYLPPGDYRTESKFQVYGKAVKVVGAGPWYTRFHAPATQDNTDVGFRAEAAAKGSLFKGFAYFGNYTSRIDGPGKVFDFANVSGIVIDDVWNEHMVCLYWGANTDRITIRNSRIRNLFADGINMTNGSTDNLVSNNDARATGDDSFALFSAIDAGGADMKNNVYENLTSTLTWRAAGVAVYGGYDNTFRNIRIADTLVYSGITISSLDFGYPMNGFGTGPTTFENISIVRAGGHFWGSQTFPGIWVFSASKVFQGIRVNHVDIVDPTYSGVMFQTNYVGGQPQFPIKDTVFTDVSITGARKSGDAYDAKSGFGLWANEMPEAGQGPAVGEVTFNGLRTSGNAVDVRNTTSTFRIHVEP